MGDETNPLDRLLNTSVPHAPRSEEEARERLSRPRQGPENDEPSKATGPAPAAPPPGEPAGDARARPQSPALPTPPSPPAAAHEGGGLMEDVWQLYSLIQYAGQIQKMFQDVDSAVPESSEATDRNGAVRVALGADGLPEKFRVTTDWKRRVAPDSLAEAVVEACEAATAKRMAAWGEALESQGLTERMRTLDRLEAEAGAAPEGSLPPAFQRKPGGFQRPPIGMLADSLLSAQESLDAFLASATEEPPGEPRGNGTDRNRAVHLTVTRSGSVTCEIDPRWAAPRTGAQIAEALNTVLGAARQDLSAAAEAADSGTSGVDVTGLNEMIAEASSVIFRMPHNR